MIAAAVPDRQLTLAARLAVCYLVLCVHVRGLLGMPCTPRRFASVDDALSVVSVLCE